MAETFQNLLKCCFKISKTARYFPFVALLLVGCEEVEKPVYSNPCDPLSENFVLPQATIANKNESESDNHYHKLLHVLIQI